MEKNRMKAFFIMVVITIMALTGCSKTDNVITPASGDNILRLVTADEQTTCDVQKTTEYF